MPNLKFKAGMPATLYNIIAAAITAPMRREKRPGKRWDRFNLRSIGPGPSTISNKARIAKLKILLPTIPPKARSGAIIEAAVPPVTNSGKDVARAKRIAPTATSPNLVLEAITSAALVKKVAEKIIIAAYINNSSQSK